MRLDQIMGGTLPALQPSAVTGSGADALLALGTDARPHLDTVDDAASQKGGGERHY